MTDDPIEYFLTEQEYYGKSSRTLAAYERVLRNFESFLTDPDRGPTQATPGTAGRRECMAWVHSLRDSYSQSTVASYASYVHRFYNYMVQVGELESNPMTLVTDEMDETITRDPTRRDISIPEMRSFVNSITHPLDQAVILMLLKTGMRVGELCNLDRRDIALAKSPLDEHPIRPALKGRIPAIYVASGDQIPNGRTAANKRKRSTIIPVDQELSIVLRKWLAISPDTSADPAPLFMSTRNQWGSRLSPEAIRAIVRQHATEVGWYNQGAGAGENVTPHYFRHFFTTHLRDRTGDRGIVKYLRGDVAEDIIDTYTHNWGGRVRETYISNIYSLFEPTKQNNQLVHT